MSKFVNKHLLNFALSTSLLVSTCSICSSIYDNIKSRKIAQEKIEQEHQEKYYKELVEGYQILASQHWLDNIYPKDVIDSYLDVGVPRESIQPLYESGTSPEIAEFFIANNLELLSRPVSYDDLELCRETELMLENRFDIEETMPFLKLGFNGKEIEIYVQEDIPADEAFKFKAAFPDMWIQDVAKAIKEDKTVDDLLPYENTGVSIDFLVEVALTEIQLDYVEILQEFGVPEQYYNLVVEKYTKDHAFTLLKLIENGEAFGRIVEDEIPINTVQSYLSKGVDVQNIPSLYRLEVTPDKAEEFSKKGIPSWAISEIASKPWKWSNYHINRLAYYFNGLQDYFNKYGPDYHGIEIIYWWNIPLAAAQKYTSIGMDLGMTGYFYQNNVSLEVIQEYRDVGVEDFMISWLHGDNIQPEQLQPWFASDNVKFALGLINQPKQDVPRPAWHVSDLSRMIREGHNVEEVEKWLAFGVFSRYSIEDYEEVGITPDMILQLADKFPDMSEYCENQDAIKMDKVLAHLGGALHRDFTYDEYYSLINREDADPDFIKNLIKNDHSLEEITYILDLELNENLYNNLEESGLGLDIFDDYVSKDIDKNHVIRLYFNGVSDIQAEFFKENNIPENLMILLAKLDPELEKYNVFRDLEFNDYHAAMLVNRNVTTEEVQPFIDRNFRTHYIATFSYQDFSLDDTLFYRDLGVPDNLITDFIISEISEQEFNDYEMKGVFVRDMPHYKFFGILPQDLSSYERYIGTDRIYNFRDIIIDRFEKGLIPDEIHPLFSTLNITQFQRYPVQLLDSSLEFLNENSNKPTALLIYANDDESIYTNGPFANKENLSMLLDGYQVVIFETDNDRIEDIVNFVAQNYEYPNLIGIAGHGNPSIINMGGEGDESVNLGMEDREQYEALTQYGTPDSVFLISCSVGRGGSYDENGERVENVANFLADVFQSKVLAASADTNVQYLIFSEDNLLKEVIYNSYNNYATTYMPADS